MGESRITQKPPTPQQTSQHQPGNGTGNGGTTLTQGITTAGQQSQKPPSATSTPTTANSGPPNNQNSLHLSSSLYPGIPLANPHNGNAQGRSDSPFN